MAVTKNELKYYRNLLQKKYRLSEKKYLLEGSKLLREAMQSEIIPEIIFITDEFKKREPQFFFNISDKNIRIEMLTVDEFKKIADTKNPQGVIAVLPISDQHKKISYNDKIIIALENISDPGNLGTIIRNCDWFGIEQIILNEDCAEIYNPKVLRSAMGSIFRCNICTPNNFFDELRTLKKNGYGILCADINGESIYNFQPPEKMTIILCNEANGPTDTLLKICDQRITIPKFGNAESLNVANASAVILSELRKKII